jgi:hypothetical protein
MEKRERKSSEVKVGKEGYFALATMEYAAHASLRRNCVEVLDVKRHPHEITKSQSHCFGASLCQKSVGMELLF